MPLQRTLGEGTWKTRQNTVEIGKAARLSYLLINVYAVEFEKVTLTDMQNLKTVC